MVKVDSIISNKMHNRAKVYISTYILMFYCVNTQLNKLDHFSQIVGPSVLTWLIHVNSHELMNITSMGSLPGKNHVKRFCPHP